MCWTSYAIADKRLDQRMWSDLLHFAFSISMSTVLIILSFLRVWLKVTIALFVL